MFNFIPVIGTVLDKVFGVVDKAIPDKDLATKLKAELQQNILLKDYDLITKELEGKSNIIIAEAKSDSWLARSWRPITMLTFVALITADWLGFTAANLTPEMKLKLYDIIQLGLGGYVIGRSAEKVLPSVMKTLGGRQ
jgi:hypothetical protein